MTVTSLNRDRVVTDFRKVTDVSAKTSVCLERLLGDKWHVCLGSNNKVWKSSGKPLVVVGNVR